MPRSLFVDSKRTEFWRGSPTSASSSAIVANNTGYMEFNTLETSDYLGAIFQLVALASNGGVRILKPGFVYVEANQDIVSSGASGYLSFNVRKNADTRAVQLITHTNGQWDGIVVATSFAGSPIVACIQSITYVFLSFNITFPKLKSL